MSFQEGPPTEIINSYDSPSNTKRNAPASGGKPSKWQPLASVEPSPVVENDPFSLGDSDDERDGKLKEQSTIPDADHTMKDTEQVISSEMGPAKDKKPEDMSR